MITLEQILDQNLLTTHFQPIVDLTRGAIIGYEALTRGPADTALALPGELFAEAARARVVVQLLMHVDLTTSKRSTTLRFSSR